MDREGEEKGGKLKENLGGKSVRSCGEGKLFCREGEEEGDGEGKEGKYLWKGKMLPGDGWTNRTAM